MWHSPNQRLRAIANAKKRERERARRPIHIKRIIASLDLGNVAPDAPKTNVRLVLNDLSYKGAGLFSPIALTPGQQIVLAISEPSQLSIKCRVAWCQEYHANSHVLSQQPHSYRLGLEFLLAPEEESAVKAFCDEVAKNHLYTQKSA